MENRFHTGMYKNEEKLTVYVIMLQFIQCNNSYNSEVSHVILSLIIHCDIKVTCEGQVHK